MSSANLIILTLILSIGVGFPMMLYGLYKFYCFIMRIKDAQDEMYINSIEREDRNIENERPV